MAATLLKDAPPEKAAKIYEKYFICAEAEKCDNTTCFMRTPRKRTEYFKILKDFCSFTNCIEKFNKSFSCKGKKMELSEFAFFRRNP